MTVPTATEKYPVVRRRSNWVTFRPSLDSTLIQAAYDAGFGCYAQFCKIFLQTYGDGPGGLLLDRGKSVENDLAYRVAEKPRQGLD